MNPDFRTSHTPFRAMSGTWIGTSEVTLLWHVSLRSSAQHPATNLNHLFSSDNCQLRSRRLCLVTWPGKDIGSMLNNRHISTSLCALVSSFVK